MFHLTDSLMSLWPFVQYSQCTSVCLRSPETLLCGVPPSESILKEQFSQEKSSLLLSIHNNSALISEKDLLVENLKSEVGIVLCDLPESWATPTTNPICLCFFSLIHAEFKPVQDLKNVWL